MAWLTAPVLGFLVPFLGPWVSAGVAYMAVGRAGPVVWTRGGRPHGRLSAALVGSGALWVLPVLNILTLFVSQGELQVPYVPGMASWLLLPLAGPATPWPPAAVALVVYAGGAVLSARVRRPWPWVVGGVLASFAYDATIVVAQIPWVA